MAMQNCCCYYCYLKSDEWRREKSKNWQLYKKGYCDICKSRERPEYHHFKGYHAIWTTKDYLNIVRLCRSCHQRCHFTVLTRKKIPLLKRQLYRRYKWVKWTYPLRSFRASVFFNWLYQAYRIY